jgi:predicted membrane-bound spermidine synthase
MARYAITIFLSAFLLFQVQPLIGKFILPWFGGSPGVWTACMLFFQVVLLAGYSYAHLISSKLSGRGQMICHVTLLAASLAFLPIAPSADWKSSGGEDAPIAQILALLVATIGLPYFLLSSTGPLLQEGFRRETGRTPYRLYSLSNVGSLLALLSYPFVFEPQLTLRTQIIGWSAGYVLFTLCCGWCAISFARSAHSLAAIEPQAHDVAASANHKPRGGDVLLWLALAACGSSMLLATTNQLCQEISSVPFLWVLPLALYLLTFIICFDHERWYRRDVFAVLLTAAVLAAVFALSNGTALDKWYQLSIYSFTLWVACMVCHGELVRSKPAAHHATLFYLIVSAGGALGGVLVGLAAPLLLNDFWEYHAALAATVILAFIATFRGSLETTRYPRLLWTSGGLAATAIGMFVGWTIVSNQTDPDSSEQNLETTRNFYGVLRVNLEENVENDNGPRCELVHGHIEHGFQYLDPEKRKLPTTYYVPSSGIGLAIEHHPRRSSADAEEQGLRIGVVGLGCGTLAAYGRPGDYIRFYEINPTVNRISNQYFTYRKDSGADRVDVVLGDARIKMEQEISQGQPQQFDVLAIDAFSSDAIPMHLLTTQCVEVFRRHLKTDGLLCVHISNRFLDLSGVTRGVAASVGCECARIECLRDSEQGVDYSCWVILTNNRQFLDAPLVSEAIKPWDEDDPDPIEWTDDYGSLWQALTRS